MIKLYYFSGDDESGVFVGAKTWREAKNFVIGHECMDGCELIDIRSHLCKENGKPVFTQIEGEHDAQDLLAAGYTNFWWSGDCEKCGKWEDRLDPIDGKLICSDCQEDDAND